MDSITDMKCLKTLVEMKYHISLLIMKRSTNTSSRIPKSQP